MRKQKAEVGKVFRKALTPEIRSINEENRTIEFIASTEAVDRYGDIIRVSGWKLDNYKKNPVFLWGHRSGEPPIGKTVELRIETAPVPALVQKVEFADAATYPFADTVFNLYKGKFLRAVSVGFMPLESPKRIRDAEDNITGYEFTNQELLELSAVPIPANPEAVARMVSKGFGTEADLERIFSGSEAPNVERELAELSISLSRLAVSIATATLSEARRLLEAAALSNNGAESGEVAVEELLESIKLAGSSVQKAPERDGTDEINTLAELETAIGSGDEQVSEGEEVFTDSRFWRTGKISFTRELR